jgi:CheY-like chemotaxis protein
MMAALDHRLAAVALIVDDDKPIAEFVAAVAAEAGYLPVVATRGQQALALARERWPALLITDLMLPFMDGGALIAALRDAAAAERRLAYGTPRRRAPMSCSANPLSWRTWRRC